jgi:DNA-binding MarR family transcriptional regulator
LEAYPKIFFACHMQHVRDPEAAKELSAHQAGILDHLDDVEPTSMTALAKHMGVTASTMSLTVDRLERGGYVRREKDPADGRKVGLRLTPAGVRIKGMQKVLDEDAVEAMLAGIPAEEREEGLRGLEILGRAAETQIQSKHITREEKS